MERLTADFLLTIAEALQILERPELPELISFGPSTHAHFKNLCPPAYFDYYTPDSIAGIKYEVENDIPFGEVRYKKWTTEGGERKLRVYKTIQLTVD
jgi:hypothetical protein